MAALQPVGSLSGEYSAQTMRPFSFIFVSVAVAGTIWFLSAGNKNEHLYPLSYTSENTSDTQAKNSVFLAAGQTKRKVILPKTEGIPSSIEAVSQRLVELKGRALKTEIETFWHTCQSDQNCESQLIELEEHLSAEHFALLKNYHALNSLWQQNLAALPFDEQQPLAPRIALFKSAAKQVWGELSEVILADEFALYDFSLQAEQLADIPTQDYVQTYKDLLQMWQGNEAALGLQSHQAKYERAVALIPNRINDSEREELILTLQQNYLSEQEIEEINNRRQQIVEQKQQATDYQDELQQLKSRLTSQRATSHASWSDSEWQRYYQQEIADFRREFFAVNDSPL